jgi:hypothetical protein
MIIMALTFTLDPEKTKALHEDHKAWLKDNLPELLKADFDTKKKDLKDDISYDMLKVFYSSFRVAQTSFVLENNSGKPCNQLIYSLIAEAGKKHKADKEKLAIIIEFQKQYRAFLKIFMEKSLLDAIHQSIDELDERVPQLKTDSDFVTLRQLFNSDARMLKTTDDCLMVFGYIGALCEALTNKPVFKSLQPDDQKKFKQFKTLAERLIGEFDYSNVKKKSLLQRMLQGVETTTATVGLLIGITAAVLGIAGLFFPPLLVPAGILGTISLISYTASVISFARMSYEGFGFGLLPAEREAGFSVIDILLLPINFASMNIFSSLSKIFNHASRYLFLIESLISNIITNVLPDIVDTDTVINDARAMVTNYGNEHYHSQDTYNFQNIANSLSNAKPSETHKVMKQTKEQVKQVEFKQAIDKLQEAKTILKTIKLNSADDKVINSWNSLKGHLDNYFKAVAEYQKIRPTDGDIKYIENAKHRKTNLSKVIRYAKELKSAGVQQIFIETVAKAAETIAPIETERIDKLVYSSARFNRAHTYIGRPKAGTNFPTNAPLPNALSHHADIIDLAEKLLPIFDIGMSPAEKRLKTALLTYRKSLRFHENRCDLLSVSSSAVLSDIQKLPIHTDVAVAFVWDAAQKQVYYVDKITNECRALIVSDKARTEFDVMMRPLREGHSRTLTNKEIRDITSITGYAHGHKREARLADFQEACEKYITGTLPDSANRVIATKLQQLLIKDQESLKASFTTNDSEDYEWELVDYKPKVF